MNIKLQRYKQTQLKGRSVKKKGKLLVINSWETSNCISIDSLYIKPSTATVPSRLKTYAFIDSLMKIHSSLLGITAKEQMKKSSR